MLVTGAGRGLGRGMALAVAAAGAEVIGVARSLNELTESTALARERGGLFVPVRADLSRIADLHDLVEIIHADGPISGVVHAAATQLRKASDEVTYEEWRTLLTVNLDAPFFLSMALAVRQRKQDISASHVFIGSLGSSIGLPRLAPYVAAKAGIAGLVRSLAAEFATTGIRFNTIAPGYFHTQLTDALLSVPAQRARILSRIPMGRLGEAKDLAGAVVYLLSDASSYVTGQLLNVDGGWLAS